MPHSVAEGKSFVVDYFAEIPIRRVLDIGPGSGAWRDALGQSHPGAHWTGVEIWGPYVDQYELAARYNRILIADARYVDWAKLGTFDLAVFGDVLEHMATEDAVELLRAALANATYVVVSVPIVEYPQGTVMGNPHEAHLVHYDPTTVKALLLDAGLLVAETVGHIVGTYVLRAPAAKE